MKKLRIKYSNNNFFNIGNVLKVYYVVFFKKKKRVYSFVGFCFFKSKTNFKIMNLIKRQKIILTLNQRSPFIIKIFNLKMYKIFIKRVSKLYFKKRSHFKDDFTTLKNRMVSSYNSFKSRYFRQAYFRRKVKYKKRRKLKLKFMRAESWFYYLNRNFYKTNIFELESFFLNFLKKIKYNDITDRILFINNTFFFDETGWYDVNFNILKKFFNDERKFSVLVELCEEVYDDIYDDSRLGNKIFNKERWIKNKICGII